MTAQITLLDKARLGRRAALAALAVARLGDDEDNVVSIFDDSFDVKFEELETVSNVVPFRRNAAMTPRPALLAA
ncbi:MAG: hypothetical protein KDK10_12250 [Maritimibacter sp.]|nr:hypothetical protein [Maritimibacter sp.]